MAEDTIFNAVIRAVDQASGPIGEILGKVKGLGAVTTAVGHHASGIGSLFKAAFGEAKHGGRQAEHAGHQARRGGEEAEHAAHRASRGYLALGGHIRVLRGHFGHLNASIGEVGHSLS
ncbi:MAG: hypothetical protein RQ966_20665, partial [Acetobacteraceae bacterium]|nr:hypothetical protein [Acetobacteraceae bacterium]